MLLPQEQKRFWLHFGMNRLRELQKETTKVCKLNEIVDAGFHPLYSASALIAFCVRAQRACTTCAR